MAWTIIGDVSGWAGYHVGDEAMLDGAIGFLRTVDADVELRVVSGDPGFTAVEYGVGAVPRLGFDALATAQAREALLAELDERGSAPPAFERLKGPGDGLIIAGGGIT